MCPDWEKLRDEGRRETPENLGISDQCVGAVEEGAPVNIRLVEEARGRAVDFGKELSKW